MFEQRNGRVRSVTAVLGGRDTPREDGAQLSGEVLAVVEFIAKYPDSERSNISRQLQGVQTLDKNRVSTSGKSRVKQGIPVYLERRSQGRFVPV